MVMADVGGTELQLAVALQLRHLGFETNQDAWIFPLTQCTLASVGRVCAMLRPNTQTRFWFCGRGFDGFERMRHRANCLFCCQM
tara:strand:+ start:521 stop:772 length:252 start_codon:yes stop_codon:yes gene_type:complete